jgi:hypothetical protein
MWFSSFLEKAFVSREFEPKFDSLPSAGRGFVFPCDADGLVPIGEFSDVLRNSYFCACAVVGTEVAWPVVAKACR